MHLLLLVLLAACGHGDETARSAGRTKIEPRIVVQLGHQAPVVAVRWVDGGRHLASFAEDGSIVFWDVASRTILDTAQVPGIWDPLSPEKLLLRHIASTDGGQFLSLVFWRGLTVDEHPGTACPPAARQPGNTAWCTFSLDLATRLVKPDPSAPQSAAWDKEMPPEAAFPLSPDGAWRPMPNHDGGQPGLFDLTDENLQFPEPSCASLFRCRYGVNLVATRGSRTIALTGDARSYFLDVDISADGQKLVRVEGLRNETAARVNVLDLMAGTSQAPFEPGRAYHRVRWIGGGRYALSSEGYGATNDMPDAMAGFPPTLLVDPQCARSDGCAAIPAYGEMTPLADDGGFIGLASLAGCYRLGRFGPSSLNCQYADGRPQLERDFSWLPNAKALSFWSGGSWRTLRQPGLGEQVITAFAVSPDQRQVAIATRVWETAGTLADRQVLRVLLFELASKALAGTPRELIRLVDPIASTLGQVRFEDATGHLFTPTAEQALAKDMLHFSDNGVIGRLDFTPDGTRIAFAQAREDTEGKGALYLLDAAGGKPPLKLAGVSRNTVPVGDTRAIDLDNRTLIDTTSGRSIATLQGTAALRRAGFIERGKLVWAATQDGTIEFFDATSGAKQLTFTMLPDDKFFALTPAGRYDTNLGPDTQAVRWLVPDAPWQSLAPQTFMRDFYEPGLYARLLDCRAANTCNQAFRPLPAIASLNRVLPRVRIASVTPAADPRSALVTLEVADGIDPGAANGKTRSGIYNPRLFLGGRLVAMAQRQGAPGGPAASDLQSWRQANGVGEVRRFTYTVPLPTGEGSEHQAFTAYAFNEDRVKSETARVLYRRPPVVPRARRAFVITIGIDDYDQRRFRLHYAVADARLLAQRLTDIPGYQMHRLTLAGERLPGGGRRRITRDTIAQALALLDPAADRAAMLARLRSAGIDGAPIEAATPDDLVVVSFSGHGWADATGTFYLIPSGGQWQAGAAPPEIATLFSSSDLARAFAPLQAGDMALIIDACHSSASVANGSFKPGPMGDSGLGQLAYDKGLRILAATQADDVARENALLGQGLLTFALAAEGLAPQGGRADLDGDGAIRLAEWLGYAVERLPGLSEDSLLRARPALSLTRGLRFSDEAPAPPPLRVQQPSLFDFNPAGRSTILRRVAG